MTASYSEVELAAMSTSAVLELHQAAKKELTRRAFELLQNAVGLYVEAHGKEAGCELACDDFFQNVAGKTYPGAWPGLLKHAVKAAG